MSAEAFIRAQTTLTRPDLVPEIALYLASEITPIWQASEAWLQLHDLPPPYWAFAWPGGQALARYILDHPALVAGRRVLDFAAGSGLAAIACALAGAARVEAAEIDAMAVCAIRLNAAANAASLDAVNLDLAAASAACCWDVVLCGDVCYEAPMTRHILPWLRTLAARAEVWVADPGRAYLPTDGLRWQAEYIVATSLELEARECTKVQLYQLDP